jgi:NADH dehydrogenase FAD-containing subunit
LKHHSVKFIQGSVQNVDCDGLAATIKLHGSDKSIQQDYDYLVAASGLRRPWPVVPQSLTRTEYLQEAHSNISATKSSEHGVVVIGGGAVGVEMAAELKMVQPNTKVTLIHSRDKLLSAEPLPDEFKSAIEPLVHEAGVDNLLLNTRVTSIDPLPCSSSDNAKLLTLSNGTTQTASHVISAISHPTPTTTYLPSSALDAEGYVRIAPSLHFPSDLADTTPANARRHFAVGDIAAWSGIKRCGAAMHMGHYAAYNIHQQILYGDVVASSSSSDCGSGSGKEGKAKFMSLEQFPNVIGLAVGKKAITYGPADGVKQGEDVEKLMFGGDLGWSICWNYLGLGRENPPPAEEPVKGQAENLGLEQEGEVVELLEKVGVKGEGVQERVAVVASAA